MGLEAWVLVLEGGVVGGLGVEHGAWDRGHCASGVVMGLGAWGMGHTVWCVGHES